MSESKETQGAASAASDVETVVRPYLEIKCFLAEEPWTWNVAVVDEENRTIYFESGPYNENEIEEGYRLAEKFMSA